MAKAPPPPWQYQIHASSPSFILTWMTHNTTCLGRRLPIIWDFAPSAQSESQNQSTNPPHMVPRAVLGLEVVTMKIEGWVLTFKPLRHYKYNFWKIWPAQPILRYGNPYKVFLGTLKNNFKFFNIYNPLMFKMSFQFSGLPFEILPWKIALLWQPWRSKYKFSLKNIAKLLFLYDFL